MSDPYLKLLTDIQARLAAIEEKLDHVFNVGRLDLTNADDDVLLNRKELAKLLSMTPGGVSNAVSAGRLPRPLKISERVARWKLGTVRDFINRKKGRLP
jgi:predicted DNA-binding transcriptional regulator AlpA